MAEKTTTGKLVAAAGGLVLIISLFLNWYGVNVGGEFGQAVNQFAQQANLDTAASGWQSLDVADFVFLIVGLLAIAPAALDIFDLEIELPFDVGLVVLIGGVISVLWILLRIIDKPGEGDFTASLEIGIWVGLAGAIAVAVGGFLQNNEEDEYEYADPAAQQYAQAPPAAAPPAAPPPAAPPAEAPPAAPPAAAPPAAPPAQPPAAPPPAAPPAQPPAAPPQDPPAPPAPPA